MINQIDFLNDFNSINNKNNNNHNNDDLKKQIKTTTNILLNKIQPKSDIEQDISVTVAVNNLVGAIATLDDESNFNINNFGDNDLYDI